MTFVDEARFKIEICLIMLKKQLHCNKLLKEDRKTLKYVLSCLTI